MALTSQQNELVKLYVAGFLRAPEKGGFEYWSSLLAGGTSMAEVADIIFKLPIVEQVYPAGLSNADFVTKIYQNVFNKAPDANGLAYWTDGLDKSGQRGQLVLDMINAGMNSPEGTPGKAFIVNRVSTASFAAEVQILQQKELAPDTLKSLLAQVTDSIHSVPAVNAATNTELANVVGAVAKAFAIEFIDAAIHWQIDKKSYIMEGFDGLEIQPGTTHTGFADLFSMDLHPDVSPTTPGYITVQLYGDNNHNWKLTASDMAEYVQVLEIDAYINRSITYQETQNFDAYVQDTLASASVYDLLVAQGPQLPAFWF
ncbi:DUF4214 domain-containing protein [Herbaspirillum sp. GCM10030257]|uniref:DUF4214 domain-containing protein n=1 Tax=Herbaspirillum sp. GCM10030257 TaxID=3273393 RepID=UPI00361FFD10